MLVLEEILASVELVRWLSGQAIEHALAEQLLLAASRPVMTSIVESDLEAALMLEDGDSHYLRIENKVDASLHPMHAGRYRERGASYMAQGECAGFTSGPRNARGCFATSTIVPSRLQSVPSTAAVLPHRT